MTTFGFLLLAALMWGNYTERKNDVRWGPLMWLSDEQLHSYYKYQHILARKILKHEYNLELENLTVGKINVYLKDREKALAKFGVDTSPVNAFRNQIAMLIFASQLFDFRSEYTTKEKLAAYVKQFNKRNQDRQDHFTPFRLDNPLDDCTSSK